MPATGSPGLNKLARVLSERSAQVASQTEGELVLDFGSIQSDYSLLTNTFPIPIPKSDYYVCRSAAGQTITVSGGEHGGHEYGDGSHTHTVTIPGIKPGDRVLVAWIQNDAVVIDVISKL